MVKRRFHLDRKGHPILQNIKIKNENNYMLIGINMSKHVLWNKPTLQASVADINKTLKHINVKMENMKFE